MAVDPIRLLIAPKAARIATSLSKQHETLEIDEGVTNFIVFILA